jgi:RP/EB family microtubule-associated protein
LTKIRAQEQNVGKMPAEKSIGMMNEAYFVGRKELLAWVNGFFKLNYEKIENVCTGALHCQIMDALHPGVVPLSKVNFNAKLDYEYIKNYKILQNVFTKLNIPKVIEVNKLIKGKHQDNLEFLQWMKRYWDVNWQGGEYDAVGRRNSAAREYEINKGGNQSASISNTPIPPVTNNNNTTPTTNTRPALVNKNGPMTSTPTSASKNYPQEAKIAMLSKKVAELKLKEDSTAKERDFYFDKLRQIEVKCEALENMQRSGIDACVFAKEIQDILYATSDETNFNEY